MGPGIHCSLAGSLRSVSSTDSTFEDELADARGIVVGNSLSQAE